MAGETVALKTELVLKTHVPLQRMAGNGISTTEGFSVQQKVNKLPYHNLTWRI